MPTTETVSLYEFFKQFPNEDAARLYLESKRWNGTIACGHCGSLDVAECKDHKPMPYRCRDCRQHFSVRIGTLLAESRLPLQKWLMAIYMMTTARKGIPSIQMARELGITQKSAWFLAQRIRETWMRNNPDGGLGNTVEIDETYIGGKEKNKQSNEKLKSGRGAVGKKAVWLFWSVAVVSSLCRFILLTVKRCMASSMLMCRRALPSIPMNTAHILA